MKTYIKAIEISSKLLNSNKKNNYYTELISKYKNN